MKRRWRKRRDDPDTEINITAFMNLMVILVPFLLITAVFSRITILDLNLPTDSQAGTSKPDKPEMQIEVIVRTDYIEIGDRQNGLIKTIEITEDGSHLKETSELLQQIKARYPEKRDVSLLLETNIAYERLVEMMDTLRVAVVDQGGEKNVRVELFPVISIGDAPGVRLQTAKRKPG